MPSSAIISDQPYSLTADQCELAVVEGKRVMNLLRHRHDLSLDVTAMLAEEVSRVLAAPVCNNPETILKWATGKDAVVRFGRAAFRFLPGTEAVKTAVVKM